MKRLSVTVASMALSSAALAFPVVGTADKAGADAILQGYVAIFGKAVETKGFVAVTPEGEAYAIAWRLQKIFDSMKPADSKDVVTIGDFTYTMTPTSDGGWTIAGEKFPALSFDVKGKDGAAKGKFDMQGYKFSSLYAPKLPEFHNSKTSADSMNLSFNMPDAKGPGSIDVVESGVAIETHASTAANGNVTANVTQIIKGIVEKIHVEGPQPMTFTYHNGQTNAAANVDGLRAAAFSKIFTWAMANSKAVKTPASEKEIRALAVAALPLWDSVKAHAEIADLAVDSDLVNVGMKSLAETISISGLNRTGTMEVGLKLEGVSAKSPLLPPIANEVLPSLLDVNLKLTMNGVDEIVGVMLDDQIIGDSKSQSPAAEEKIAAIAAKGSPKLIVAPSHLTAPSLDMGVEGELLIKQPTPEAHFTFTAKNFDKTLELAKLVSEISPEAAQAPMIAAFVKGLAKDGPDGQLIWKVDLSPDGAVQVNGTPMPTDK